MDTTTILIVIVLTVLWILMSLSGMVARERTRQRRVNEHKRRKAEIKWHSYNAIDGFGNVVDRNDHKHPDSIVSDDIA